MSLALPQLLAGRYVLDQLLGSGAFAETFRATDRRTQRAVAVKLLREQFAGDPDVAARFAREAETVRAVHHPAVVAVLDHGGDGGRLFTVLELVEGGNLKEFVQARAPLSIPESLALIQGVLRGLEAIHRQQVVHRDVKPENILMTRGGMPKLSDFGIARAASTSELTRTGLTLGTAAYMAPEQALGEPLGPAADLYAAGVVLFELLTGQLPFPGDDPLQVMYRQVHSTPPAPSTLNPAIPPSLNAAVLRALDKDPSRRYSSAAAMWRALLRAWNASPRASQAAPAMAVRPLSRARTAGELGHARYAVGVATAAALLLLAALGVSSYQLGSRTRLAPAATTAANVPVVETLPTPTPSGPPPDEPTPAAAQVFATAPTWTPERMLTPEPVALPQPVVTVPDPAAAPATHTPAPTPTPTPPALTPEPTPVATPANQTELASEPVDSAKVTVQSDAPPPQPWHQGNGPWKATPAPAQPAHQPAVSRPATRHSDPPAAKKAPPPPKPQAAPKAPPSPKPKVGHEASHAAPDMGHGQSPGHGKSQGKGTGSGQPQGHK
ncbi:MAG TPA: protein kinase [Thermomicrobiaceae bacterium]|nr:protein kinase [Thermomicrobiaceae bacterium]